jgi:transposase-like protein
VSTAIATVDRQPRIVRDYSAEFKAEVLAALKSNNGNVYGTAKEYDVPESTLVAWVEQEARYRDLRDNKLRDLATKHELNLHRLADSVSEHDLTNVPLVQKATAIGILTDKMLLLRGQPTSIVAALSSELKELLPSVDAIATEQRLTQHEAALKLAAQLADVPELAAMLTEWANGEKARQLAISSVSTGGDNNTK